MSTRVELGCGQDQRDGWLGVDISPVVKPDLVTDLAETPWPLGSDSVDELRARHVLEHLPDLESAMREITRVVRPGGEVTVTYPIGHTRFQDPTHRQFWNVRTAENIAGREKHNHETSDWGLSLVDKSVDWWIRPPSILLELTTRARLAVCGAGPWLEQVTGLFGEVTARFEVADESG
jgi:SAM-dependent methyltransferase